MTLAAQERVLDAHRMASAINFHAQPFQSAAQRLIKEQLPPKDFLDSYAGALEAWQTGEIEAAIAQLESLLSSPGSAIAQREIGRMEEIVREVNALRALEPSDLYDEQLLSLYHSLDRDRDRHIVTLLQAEYEDSLAATEIRAQRASAVAADAWTDYRARGGISSTQRLKTHIDQAYKGSAALLSQAGRAAREARRLYEQASVAIPSEEATTLAMIQKEIALQHQALDELAGVLKEPRLLEMRSLLPPRAR
jgi:hypothetical protein